MNDSRVTRRKLLAGSAAAASGIAIYGASRLPAVREFITWQFHEFLSYDGFPERHLDDAEFWDHVSTDFSGYEPGKLEEGEPNIMVDFRVFEKHRPYSSYLEELEDWFDRHGVNALCMEHGEGISMEFLEGFDGDPTDVIGDPNIVDHLAGYEGLYGEVNPVYRDAAVQVFLVPDEMEAPSNAKGAENSGFALGSRAALELSGYPDMSLVKHEIGHTLTLPHVDKKDNLMYGGDVGDDAELDSWQWEHVREQLS